MPLASTELIGPLYRSIIEYGFSNKKLGSKSICNEDILSMGLDKLEEGILFPALSSPNLTTIQTKWLRDGLLLDSFQDDPAYSQMHSLYFMYLPSWTLQITSLYTIAKIESSNSKSIDIFMPLSATITEFIQWGALQKDVFQLNGIGELVFKTEQGTDKLKIGHGKILTVLSGSISKNDMNAIQSKSEPFFGCTGDCTISEAFLRHKVPLYDDLGHKAEFVKSLNKIAVSNKLKHFLILQVTILRFQKEIDEEYKRNTPQESWLTLSDSSYDLKHKDSILRKSIPALSPKLPIYANTLADLYLNKPLIAESSELATFIVKNHNCEPRLKAIVSRSLVLTNYPHLIQEEENLWNAFKDNRISEEDIVNKLNEAILKSNA